MVRIIRRAFARRAYARAYAAALAYRRLPAGAGWHVAIDLAYQRRAGEAALRLAALI